MIILGPINYHLPIIPKKRKNNTDFATFPSKIALGMRSHVHKLARERSGTNFFHFTATNLFFFFPVIFRSNSALKTTLKDRVDYLATYSTSKK